MYSTHVPIICAEMRAKPHVFARGVMFALLSARVKFPRVPEQCLELEQRGKDATCLWGWKFGAYEYVTAERKALWARATNTTHADQCIADLCTIPGMGIVKAAFVAQMLGHDVACMDVRNVAREGIDILQFKTRGPKQKARTSFRPMIDRYVALTAGRAEELWDTWCTEVAADYGQTPEGISEAHVASIVGPKWRALGRSLVPQSCPLYPRYPRYSVSDADIPF